MLQFMFLNVLLCNVVSSKEYCAIAEEELAETLLCYISKVTACCTQPILPINRHYHRHHRLHHWDHHRHQRRHHCDHRHDH